MGRRDAVQVILEVVAECRRLLPALVVTYTPGWETAGNGTSANYDFGNVHHTASNTSAAKPFPTETLLRAGRSDLSGPLCNFAGPWCTVELPRLHVVAANPANHAGASRASGPVPALALYNPRTLGLEIDYAGSSPMTAGQLLVAKAWARAVAKVVGGGNVEVVRAHAETSLTGKWDPGFAPGKTIDMAAFRRDAAALTATAEGAFMAALTEAEQRRLLENTDLIINELRGPDWRAGKWGWPTVRYGVAKQESLTLLDLVRALDRQANSKIDATKGRPGAGLDDAWGHAMDARALAAQAVELARTAATRELTVDASRIKMPAAPAVSLDLTDADVERIARRVDELLAARLAA